MKNQAMLATFHETAKPGNSMFCTLDDEKYHSFTEHTWIGNTGSSCNFTCNIKQVDGLIKEVVLFPVEYYLKSEANLFSIICELFQGTILGNDACKNITLKKGDGLVMFDCKVKKNDGWVVGVELLPVPTNEAHLMADAPHIIFDDDESDSARQMLRVLHQMMI